jgi:Icc-related predicted phosphoesterase
MQGDRLSRAKLSVVKSNEEHLKMFSRTVTLDVSTSMADFEYMIPIYPAIKPNYDVIAGDGGKWVKASEFYAMRATELVINDRVKLDQQSMWILTELQKPLDSVGQIIGNCDNEEVAELVVENCGENVGSDSMENSMVVENNIIDQNKRKGNETNEDKIPKKPKNTCL